MNKCVYRVPLLGAGVEASYAEHVAPLRAASPSVRFVLVSATLPQHTFDELQELFPGLGAAFGPGLHRTATGAYSPALSNNKLLSRDWHTQIMVYTRLLLMQPMPKDIFNDPEKISTMK